MLLTWAVKPCLHMTSAQQITKDAITNRNQKRKGNESKKLPLWTTSAVFLGPIQKQHSLTTGNEDMATEQKLILENSWIYLILICWLCSPVLFGSHQMFPTNALQTAINYSHGTFGDVWAVEFCPSLIGNFWLSGTALAKELNFPYWSTISCACAEECVEKTMKMLQ